MIRNAGKTTALLVIAVAFSLVFAGCIHGSEGFRKPTASPSPTEEIEVTSTPEPTATPEATPSEELRACSSDDDCIKVATSCCSCNSGGTATTINQNSKQQWDERLRQECTGVMCLAVMSNDPSCFAKPTCVQNQCTLVTQYCDDSDSGRDYVMNGTARNGSGSSSDFCNGFENLTEYFCEGDSIRSETTACPPDSFCHEGKCVTDLYEELRQYILLLNEGQQRHIIMNPRGEQEVFYPADDSFDKVAEAYLINNYVCHERIKEFLGMAPRERLVGQLKVGDAGTSGVIAPRPYEQFIQKVEARSEGEWETEKGRLTSFYKNYTLRGECGDAEGMTFYFTVTTPLPPRIINGLGNLMSYQMGYEKQGGQSLSDVCFENEILYPYYGNSYYYPADATKQYMNLNERASQYPENLYTTTAACFWNEVEQRYGHDGLKKIMAFLDGNRTYAMSTEVLDAAGMIEGSLGENPPFTWLQKYGRPTE
ncbi:hypothetical protein H0O03_02880 [Candidatus Micrarchaeota archaeon]|nr:hypothetical protein [Candidatus Micrarchaeota archaeon]